MRQTSIITAILALLFTGCVSMGTIREMPPRGVWTIDGNYDEVGFCIVDTFEGLQAGNLIFSTLLMTQNRTHEGLLLIQGYNKNDQSMGLFEIRCKQSSPDETGLELRGIRDTSTTRAISAIERCIR